MQVMRIVGARNMFKDAEPLTRIWGSNTSNCEAKMLSK